jgi:DNA primase large subunit
LTVTFDLPIWFPLQKIKEVDQTRLEEKTWKNYLIDRLNLLGPNGQKDFKKESWEENEEYLQRGIKEIQSHVILSLGACLDPRLSAWFVEMEGDLFQFRFIRSRWAEKKQIIDFLFPKEELEPTWLELEELNEYLGEDLYQKLVISRETTTSARSYRGLTPEYALPNRTGINNMIAIDFRYASFLVKTRKSLLYKGWVLGSIDKLSSTIKKQFEKQLNNQLTDYAFRLETEMGGHMKKQAKEINALLYGLVKPRKEYSMEGIQLKGDFDAHTQYYPPCIQDLISTVNTIGYIPHWERLQLGLFLKHTGMDVDEQLQYWYSKAVDNIGISFDEFSKRAGYIIRHIYGLEGGRIDYEMPSCSTIQTKMYCTFRHRDFPNINERLNKYLDTLEDKEKQVKRDIGKTIIDIVARGLPSHACAAYLYLMSNIQVQKIRHPMEYLRMSAKSSGILSETTSNDEKDKRDTTDDKI